MSWLETKLYVGAMLLLLTGSVAVLSAYLSGTDAVRRTRALRVVMGIAGGLGLVWGIFDAGWVFRHWREIAWWREVPSEMYLSGTFHLAAWLSYATPTLSLVLGGVLAANALDGKLRRRLPQAAFGVVALGVAAAWLGALARMPS